MRRMRAIGTRVAQFGNVLASFAAGGSQVWIASDPRAPKSPSLIVGFARETRPWGRSFPGTRCAWGCAMLGRLRSLAPLLSLTALLGLSVHCQACASSAHDGGESAEDELRRKAKLQLVVTVDWEGRDLREENLRAMETLRARFPQVKIIHFLNAGYYEKPLANAADVTARVTR